MTQGVCIHCARPIPWEPAKPLCFDCWVVANATDDPVEGRHCHTCGKVEPTTLDKPLCEACYLGAHLGG